MQFLVKGNFVAGTSIAMHVFSSRNQFSVAGNVYTGISALKNWKISSLEANSTNPYFS